jgi:uncharacterized Rmd1/YagE family protein
MEISERVEIVNQRVGVITDMLQMLKDHMQSMHGERLEYIVIILICLEIAIGLFTICIDAIGLQQ